jgi:hypothetical protein
MKDVMDHLFEQWSGCTDDEMLIEHKCLVKYANSYRAVKNMIPFQSIFQCTHHASSLPNCALHKNSNEQWLFLVRKTQKNITEAKTFGKENGSLQNSASQRKMVKNKHFYFEKFGKK